MDTEKVRAFLTTVHDDINKKEGKDMAKKLCNVISGWPQCVRKYSPMNHSKGLLRIACSEIQVCNKVPRSRLNWLSRHCSFLLSLGLNLTGQFSNESSTFKIKERPMWCTLKSKKNDPTIRRTQVKTFFLSHLSNKESRFIQIKV